jgi:hypothetical protein
MLKKRCPPRVGPLSKETRELEWHQQEGEEEVVGDRYPTSQFYEGKWDCKRFGGAIGETAETAETNERVYAGVGSTVVSRLVGRSV